jgi:two-component system, NtrC family, sensor kinase
LSPAPRSSVLIPRLLIATGLMVPMFLFGVAAWESWRDTRLTGEATLLRSISVIADSFRHVLRTEELILDNVATHLRGLTREDISSLETSRYLGNESSVEQIRSISVLDRAGSIIGSSVPAEIGQKVADRKLFALSSKDDRYLSAVFSGQSPQPVALSMIIPRISADGGVDGSIRAELDVRRLAGLFQDVTGTMDDAVIAGAGGEAMDLHGNHADLAKLEVDDPMMRHIAARTDGGMPAAELEVRNGIEMSYKRVPGYPIWVGIAVDRSVVMANWLRSLRIYGAAAAAGAVALLGVSWFSIVQARRKQDALVSLHAETERRLAAEQHLRHTRHLEALGRLAAGIAHDFNNLLMVIMGNLEMIGHTNELTSRSRSLLAAATGAAERGSRLTSSLLAFGRRQLLRPSPLNVNQQIKEFLPIIEQALGDSVRIDLKLEPELARCRADAVQLEAALLNIAINARDAMPNGGTLTIETRQAVLDDAVLADNPEAKPGPYVAVASADTGIGMPEDVMANAVEPFFTTKATGQGSGLGLSQVFGFVRQLGGHMTIQSTLGSGSIVTLFLPIL